MTTANSVSYRFVLAVLAIAVGTLVIRRLFGPAPPRTNALRAAVALLIVACPFALGLATPMSIGVAAGRGAPVRL